MTAGTNSTSGRDNGPAKRLGSVYLWIALFLTIPIGRLRDLVGMEALICGYAVFVALTAAAIWKVGTAKTKAGRVSESPYFLPGLLLAAGPLTLLLGASVTGEPTAVRPGDYLLNTTAILLGSVILVGGFVVLSVRLWEAGQRLLPVLGLASLLIGAAVWLANLVFRYAVVASGAGGLQARVEDRAWVANEYLRGLEGTPSWMELLLVWTDMLQLAFIILSYLSAAAFGAALIRAGRLGRVGGGLFVVLNLTLTVVVVAGIILAGGSLVAAWTAYILTAPFMVFIMPYFVGVALMRRGDHRGVTRREKEPAIEAALLR
jgi:hypothetical protein